MTVPETPVVVVNGGPVVQWWTSPRPPAGRVAAAATIAGVVAGAAVPIDRPGIGWLAAALASAVAVFLAGRIAKRPALDQDAAERQALDPVAAERQALDPVAAERQALDPVAAERQALDQDAAKRQALDQDAAKRQALDPVAAGRSGLDPVRAAAPGDRIAGPSARRPVTDPARPVVPFTETRADAVWRWLFGTVALLLVAVGVVRAAEWLFALCLLAAFGCGAVAVVGGRSLGGLVASVGSVPLAALRGIPWYARSMAALSRDVSRESTEGNGRALGRLLVSVLVGVVLVALFGALLSSADAAFARIVGGVLPSLEADSVVRFGALLVVGTLGTVGACYLRMRPLAVGEGATASGRRTVRLMEWAVPVALLDLLFASFVAVQFAVLFGGNEHVLRTEGLTYARYARGGFWQLLAVTALSLGVVAVAARLAPRDTAPQRRWLRLLLGTLAALMLVVVASALTRMAVYEQAYGFTRQRLVVSAVELLLGVVFLLVLAAGVRLRAAWMPRAVALAAALTLLGLAALNPDGFIAERNIARWHAGLEVDWDYLGQLSDDAVPAVVTLPEPRRTCVLRSMRLQRLDRDPDPWAGWNYGRSRAAGPLWQQQAASPPFSCGS